MKTHLGIDKGQFISTDYLDAVDIESDISEDRKRILAQSFNGAKESYESLYDSSIRASGFNYTYQVVKMYANLAYEYRRIPSEIREEFALTLPINEPDVVADLNRLTSVTSPELISKISTKLFS